MNYFIKFKLEEDNRQNFKYLLNKRFENKEKIISDIKIDTISYKQIKEFYFYYNYESNPLTFNEKLFTKYNFEFLKHITNREMQIAFGRNVELDGNFINTFSLKNKNNLLNKAFFLCLGFFNFDIPSKNVQTKSLIKQNISVEWNFFYKILENYIIKRNLTPVDVRENFADLANLLEHKDLDFEYYQTLYKKVKRNIFYSALRDFLYSTRDTSQNVLE